MMKGFPFYPYHAKEAQSVLSDILDGFFPYDLKTKYPEGVPLKPIDLTEEMFDPKDVQKKKMWGIEDFDKPEGLMDKQTFLKQFPKNVVKDGKLIPI